MILFQPIGQNTIYNTQALQNYKVIQELLEKMEQQVHKVTPWQKVVKEFLYLPF